MRRRKSQQTFKNQTLKTTEKAIRMPSSLLQFADAAATMRLATKFEPS
jgi:hypothetical protein